MEETRRKKKETECENIEQPISIYLRLGEGFRRASSQTRLFFSRSGMHLIHALVAELGLDRVSGTLLVLGTRIDLSSLGVATQQNWAAAVI